MFLDGLQKCAGASSPRRFGVSKKAPAESLGFWQKAPVGHMRLISLDTR